MKKIRREAGGEENLSKKKREKKKSFRMVLGNLISVTSFLLGSLSPYSASYNYAAVVVTLMSTGAEVVVRRRRSSGSRGMDGKEEEG